jgi:hypothetical protein
VTAIQGKTVSATLPASSKPRRQLSMVLPVELIEAIKVRAAEQKLSITGYMSELVRRDLGLPSPTQLNTIGPQLQALEERIAALEQRSNL